MTTYYKVLHEDGRAFHGGRGSWPLPVGDEPGEWTKEVPRCVPCQSGYHVCEPADLIHWLGPAIFEVEIRGDIVRDSQKTVAQQARLIRRMNWDGKIAASFAIDCAMRALNAEKKAGRTPDPRLYDALKVARKFLRGEATQAEADAAESAAWSARSAWSAWSARSAESAAWSAWSAESAARSAAWSARSAWSAAWSAAESAARSAEQKWQTKRLMEYLNGKRGI